MMTEQIFLLLKLASMLSHLEKSEPNNFFFFFFFRIRDGLFLLDPV